MIFDRIRLALQRSKELNLVIVLKGHHTLITTPDGKASLNSTGNAGMATSRQRGFLTGLLTGLWHRVTLLLKLPFSGHSAAWIAGTGR